MYRRTHISQDTMLMYRIASCLLVLVLMSNAEPQDQCNGEQCREVEEGENIYAESSQHMHDLPPCPNPPPNLGTFPVDATPFSMSEVNRKVKDVEVGGRWKPRDCTAVQKVAILVPYRNRDEDLCIFLNNIHGFMRAQLLEYGVFLIEQADSKHFNRGALLNIGVVASLEVADYDCIVLHDVDKFPEDTRNMYTCSDQPTHLIGRQRYVRQQYRERPYDTYFGGVTAISTQQMILINGFSNMFWGWGSEDDDLLNRMKHHDLAYKRVDDVIGSYLEIWHPYGFVNPRRHEVVKEGKARYESDGINSLDYTTKAVTSHPLYTNITVELHHEDPYTEK